MRNGLIASVAAHALLIAWGLVTLASTAPIDPGPDALPIELVQVADVTALKKGAEDAKPLPTLSANDPTDKVSDGPPTPKPPPTKPVAKATPPPPPPPPPSPQPVATPPQQPPAEEQTASVPPASVQAAPASPSAPAQPPPEPVQPAAQAPSTPPEPVAVKDPVPLPHVRPTLPSPEQKPNDFNDKIAALLDKSPQNAAAQPSTGPASLGVAMDNATDRMTETEIDGLRAQIQRCWILPVGWTDPREVTVTVRFRLNPDGTVNGNPVVIEGPASQYGQVSAENAVRAVLQCGPYKLPPEKYDQWSEVQLRFAPTG